MVAEKFGWTPTQVDEEPAYYMDWLVSIAGIVAETKASSYDSKQSKTRPESSERLSW